MTQKTDCLKYDGDLTVENPISNQKLAVVPGESFGQAGYIRLTYGLPIAKLKEASARLEKFINHYK